MDDNRNANRNSWLINRIGVLNFWYYDEEEFSFCDGRLLLRGSNGSGKSVTMQSFIPLLLDGNKSPERLDPFGSRARKIENYLLGDDENGKEESTGYLYMEFVKPDTQNYLTLGMGLRGRRGKALDFWGFCISDGRRIGKDFFLYKDVGEKIPLSKIEIRNRIGEGGELHEGQKDYMAMVNRLLFGFDLVEDYDELIKLLIQLRTPKLSKDFKPTVVYEIMNNSLQALSDEDLRPMSEAIENMDNIKSQLEVLKESKKACTRITYDFERYNKFVLMEKSREFLRSCDRLNELTKNEEKLSGESRKFLELHKIAIEEREALNLKLDGFKHREQELRKHDSFMAKKELDSLLEKLSVSEREKKNKEEQLEAKKRREREIAEAFSKLENEKYEKEKAIKEELEIMADCADKLYFYEHNFMSDELAENFEIEYNFDSHKNETERLRQKISSSRRAFEREKSQNEVYDRALAELEMARKEKEDASRELEKAEMMFSEIKEEFIEKVYAWERDNIELKISREQLTNVARAVNRFGTEGTYDDILSEVRKFFDVHKENLSLERNSQKTDREKVLKDIEIKQKELEEWKTQKDPEPVRDEKVSACRKWLAEQGIAYVPLYKACDFRPVIDESVKANVEESLVEMGILDALIVSPEHRNIVQKMPEGIMDKIIFPEPKHMRHNLSMVLTAVANEKEYAVPASVIDDCLSSLGLNDFNETPHINEKGLYRHGIVVGSISKQYSPKFIGHEARKRYREENIARIEKEIHTLREAMHIIEQKINAVTERIKMLEAEITAFPKKDDLVTAQGFRERAKLRLASASNDVERRETSANKAYGELKIIRDEIIALTAKLEFGRTLEAYVEAESEINSYRDMIMRLESLHNKLLNVVTRLNSLLEQKEDNLVDIDNISYDIKVIDRDINESHGKKQNLEEILKNLKFEDIEHEIEECLKALSEIPEKINKTIEISTRNLSSYEQTVETLNTIKGDISYAQKVKELREDIFRNEYNLGYCVQKEELESAKQAAKAYDATRELDKEGKSTSDYSGALQQKYHENRQFMAEYNLIIENIFDLQKEVEDEAIRRIAISARRIDFSARVQGKVVDFNSLKEFIDNSIEENEKLLKESDRQLFEDILANTVGKKIRARIHHSEMWVKKMNFLMESMNTSSGLSFSLQWRKRIAESEEQIGTRELVEILMSDSQLLSDEQMESLAQHFRSKIAVARKEQEDSGTSQSFHAIMKEVLDYRKWFEFQLLYRKTGEAKKELTNNAFDRFSGGEKAMAMYVPLFSAVYARYESARKDAPRIISLDEAFAGVDENNIRDMFRLLEELKLSFVINSQILWGDYDTVPALSICELIRPNNADFVTVIRYKWNGKLRELVV